MTTMETAAPFIGAVLQEALHWYQLRERLNLVRYRKTLRSPGYWIITLVMIVGGGFGTLIYFQGRLTQGDLLLAGAAFPTLFKRLIGSFVTKQVKLGGPPPPDQQQDPDESVVATYLTT